MRIFAGLSMMVFTLIFALPASGARVGSGVTGEGPVIEEPRELADFSKIQLNGSIDAEVIRSETLSVTVKAQQNLIPLVITKVEDDELIIYTEESYSSSKDIKVMIELPRITGLTVEGSGDISVTGPFEAEDMVIKIQGSGDISADGLTVDSLACNVMGSGDVTVRGTAASASYNVKGSGDINAYKVDAQTVTANVYGSGDIHVHAKVSLDAKVFGSGDINYKGDPEVSRSTFGSGDIQKK